MFGLIIITRKRLHKVCQRFYEKGLNKGYELAWQMRKIEDTNKGFIISGKMQEDITKILKEKGL